MARRVRETARLYRGHAGHGDARPDQLRHGQARPGDAAAGSVELGLQRQCAQADEADAGPGRRAHLDSAQHAPGRRAGRRRGDGTCTQSAGLENRRNSSCRQHLPAQEADLLRSPAILSTAVRRKHLKVNPLTDDGIDFAAPKAVEAVDPRTVPNPRQAKALIAATTQIEPTGPPLTAFFGCLYYSGMRPGEAVSLHKEDLVLPDLDPDADEQEDDEWGIAYLDTSAPRIGRSWSDTGRTRQERQLKHRPEGTVRPVPV